jgi:hypothetical protein
MTGNNRNVVTQRYRNHGVHAEPSTKDATHVYILFYIFVFVYLRPWSHTISETVGRYGPLIRNTNEFSGRTSNAR